MIDYVTEKGGVCDKKGEVTEDVGGRRVTRTRSLNTGIVTLQNYQKKVAPRVSHITLAHEIGNNFGSPVSVAWLLAFIL